MKVCSWQWLEFGAVEQERVLGERVAVFLRPIDQAGTLATVRLEFQEDVHDDENPVLDDLVARFSKLAPGMSKVNLRSKKGIKVQYRAGEVVEEGTPLIKSFEL